jgi:hypothetical protein
MTEGLDTRFIEQTIVIANRGHAPLLDEQEAINAIATFLESV